MSTGNPSAPDSTTATPALRRGRPRSEARKQAILRAAFELLGEHGLAATSMDAVADRAGVSKATIYRWWDSKELLALDALYAAWDTPGPAPRRTARYAARCWPGAPWVRLVATGLPPDPDRPACRGQNDPEFGRAYRAHFVEPRRARHGRCLRAPSPAESSPPASTSKSRSTCSGAPCITACFTDTRHSTSASPADRWTRRSSASCRATTTQSERRRDGPAHTGCPLTESATATLPRVAFEYGQR